MNIFSAGAVVWKLSQSFPNILVSHRRGHNNISKDNISNVSPSPPNYPRFIHFTSFWFAIYKIEISNHSESESTSFYFEPSSSDNDCCQHFFNFHDVIHVSVYIACNQCSVWNLEHMLYLFSWWTLIRQDLIQKNFSIACYDCSILRDPPLVLMTTPLQASSRIE